MQISSSVTSLNFVVLSDMSTRKKRTKPLDVAMYWCIMGEDPDHVSVDFIDEEIGKC